MRFSTALFSFAAFAAVVFAQQNPIIKPDGTDAIVAGEPYLITWKPTTKGNITLTLRQGDSKNLKTLYDFANVENSGSFKWVPDAALPSGNDYAIMISSVAGELNYTPLISITGKDKSKSKQVSSTTDCSSTTGHPSKTAAHSSSSSSTTMATSTKPTMTQAANSTVIHGNSTMTNSPSKTSLLPTSTEEASASESVAPNSGAVGVRSPLALVACLVGAIVYFN